jgi:uncharacterized protein
MEVAGVRVELPANTPMVVLREQEGRHRLLPIMIGSPEASAIHNALEGVVPQRPLTHDLMVNVVAALGAELESVIVTEVRDHTFFAELHLRTNGGPKVISSRPSDALALAVRTDAPIFVSDQVIEDSAIEFGGEPEEQDEIVDEFRKFLEDVSPEDFSSS